MTSTATRSACSIFQSTLSVRRATGELMDLKANYSFQSTLSVRRATKPQLGGALPEEISIHALRKESDI